MPLRPLAWVSALAVVGHTGCGGAGPTARQEPASSWAPETHSWQLQVGVDRQRVPLSALGVTDREAWLARRPRFVVRVEGFDRGRAQVVYPFIAAADDPSAVELLGFFGDDEAQREAAWSPIHELIDGVVAGSFDVALVAGDDPAEALPGGLAARVSYRLEPSAAEGRLTYTAALGNGAPGHSGALDLPDGTIQVGPIEIQVTLPATQRPRLFTARTGTWGASIGIPGRLVPLDALGVTDSATWLARHPRVELAFAGDRIAAPFIAAAGDPAAVELVSFLGRFASASDEFLSTSLESATPDSRSGHFVLAVVDDEGPLDVLVGSLDHVIVTYALIADHCTAESGRCIAEGVTFRVYAPDGIAELGAGAAFERDGLWIIAVGPIEVGVVVPDVGWSHPD
jgi:hypothetical protein